MKNIIGKMLNDSEKAISQTLDKTQKGINKVLDVGNSKPKKNKKDKKR